MIEIEAERVEALAREFRGEYGRMAEHLKIMNKRMVLLNPVSLCEIMCRNSLSAKNPLRRRRTNSLKLDRIAYHKLPLM